MVTASHNLKNDNGYKVYSGDGAQIIPPTDEDIATSSLKNLEPWGGVSALLRPESGLLKDPSEKSEEVQCGTPTWRPSQRNCTQKSQPGYATVALTSQSTLKIVYTAMHGVGCEFVKRTVDAFGFSVDRLLLVSEQCTPDPEFPTVPFPNPEEKGALVGWA
uniref:Alpha-D-phosphohexomutase alpha/beta/alpha domain-containing protein n=1 Tax=Chromera velia CCMP2878 TaxID=1169474 RepID=A0A0G4GGH9_9ALVE|eukprot:Cvel_21811.t1-p1 / transcript=Cvel_21811.t1 / gene=Cvel_21811 / organism=Chromera_velia_CCMP2878 / gene_product=Phosphoglucomutase-2, putative / transcript_product=Phosphoglucomutase-2, putative / location=Cvel_scaffold2079:25222-29708(+) / protein_length=160 / sequence_SO=supercontig / SO=protein_coding / is_pseudo=false